MHILLVLRHFFCIVSHRQDLEEVKMVYWSCELWDKFDAGGHRRGSLEIGGDKVYVDYAVWHKGIYRYTDDWGRSRQRTEDYYSQRGQREPFEDELRKGLECARAEMKKTKDDRSKEILTSVIQTLEACVESRRSTP
jgi:hypothetical protein